MHIFVFPRFLFLISPFPVPPFSTTLLEVLSVSSGSTSSLALAIAEEGVQALKGPSGFERTLVFLKYLYNTVRSHAKSMSYVTMCARDQEIDSFANLFFANCIHIRKI